jgi:bifunctional enzyme CysN/CysC
MRVKASLRKPVVTASWLTFNQIVEDYTEFAKQLGIQNITFIPISAFKGDNIIEPSERTPWYRGTTLMGFLETVEIDEERLQKSPFRMPVQWVNRPNLDFRGFSGQIAGGVVKPGDRIRVLPSGKESTVDRIVTRDGDLEQAVAGQSITITLADEIDISRGDLLVEATEPASVAKQFETTIVWMHEEPMLPGRTYLMKVGTKTVSATLTDIKYQVNVNTLEHTAAKKLELNGIGICTISLDQSIPFDPYTDNQDTGGFILIDRLSNYTVGAGLINFALRRSQNITMQHVDVNKEARSTLKHQKPCILWLTGLSGAGKSTIANLVEIFLMFHL